MTRNAMQSLIRYVLQSSVKVLFSTMDLKGSDAFRFYAHELFIHIFSFLVLTQKITKVLRKATGYSQGSSLKVATVFIFRWGLIVSSHPFWVIAAAALLTGLCSIGLKDFK